MIRQYFRSADYDPLFNPKAGTKRKRFVGHKDLWPRWGSNRGCKLVNARVRTVRVLGWYLILDCTKKSFKIGYEILDCGFVLFVLQTVRVEFAIDLAYQVDFYNAQFYWGIILYVFYVYIILYDANDYFIINPLAMIGHFIHILLEPHWCHIMLFKRCFRTLRLCYSYTLEVFGRGIHFYKWV